MAERQAKVKEAHDYFKSQDSFRQLLNFESRLEKDLNKTTKELVEHMKSHSLLSKENLTIMAPLEASL